MEPRKSNDDCYYYYRSGCLKGDRCTYRHEPLALGCRSTCFCWQRGYCGQKRCSFRHELLPKRHGEESERDGNTSAAANTTAATAALVSSHHGDLRAKIQDRKSARNFPVTISGETRRKGPATGRRHHFKQHRGHRGPRITTAFDGNGDSSNYVRISRDPTEPGRRGLTLAELRIRKHLGIQGTGRTRVARLRAKSAAPYANKGTVASSALGRIPYQDLRAKILARRISIHRSILHKRNGRISKLMSNLQL
jgi:hypothetical protein